MRRLPTPMSAEIARLTTLGPRVDQGCRRAAVMLRPSERRLTRRPVHIARAPSCDLPTFVSGAIRRIPGGLRGTCRRTWAAHSGMRRARRGNGAQPHRSVRSHPGEPSIATSMPRDDRSLPAATSNRRLPTLSTVSPFQPDIRCATSSTWRKITDPRHYAVHSSDPARRFWRVVVRPASRQRVTLTPAPVNSSGT